MERAEVGIPVVQCADDADDREEVAEEVKALAGEITHYLATRHNVADTLEGICHWWINHQRIQETENSVRTSVEYLCQQGLLEAIQLPDGRIIYRSSRRAGAE